MVSKGFHILHEPECVLFSFIETRNYAEEFFFNPDRTLFEEIFQVWLRMPFFYLRPLLSAL